MAPQRFGRLVRHQLPGGLTLLEARAVRARLLGLALLPAVPADVALLIPRCSSVHTFCMRFELDVVFLDASGQVLRIARDVAPRRLLRQRGASCVLETAPGQAERFLVAWAPPLRRPRPPAGAA